MKKLFLLIALLFWLPAARAQQTTAQVANPLGGPISATSAACTVAQSCLWMKLAPNTGTANVTITGTFSATLVVEYSSDGGNNFVTAATYTAPVTAASFATSAFTDIRVRASAYVSGIANVNIQAAYPTSGGASASGGTAGQVSLAGNGGVSNGIWVNTSDVLWFQYTGTYPATSFYQTFRIQQPNGTIYNAGAAGTAWTVSCTGTANGQGTGIQVPVAGWLIGTFSYPSSATNSFVNGAIYAQHFILNAMPSGGGTSGCVNTLANSNYSVELAGSNFSTFYGVAWNVGGGNLIQSSVSGPGNPAQLTVSNPAAGADWTTTTTIPISVRFQVLAIHFTLTTGLTAGTRQVCFSWGGSSLTNSVFNSCASITQALSTTVSYDFMVGVGASGVSGVEAIVPLPANWYISNNQANFSMGTHTTALQTTDQFSNIYIVGNEWQEVD
jgi:hypothetical protein